MNGYFQLVSVSGGTGLQIHPPTGDGEKVSINEVIDYLNSHSYVYDLPSLNRVIQEAKEVVEFPLSEEPCPKEDESFLIHVTDDAMSAIVRFHPPSTCGEQMTLTEFLSDLKKYNIIEGIQIDLLKSLFEFEREYCKDYEVAKGQAARQGSDAKIEYFFKTDLNSRPTLNEDGSVDFFHLETISPCGVGQTLAKMTPADFGDYGWDIRGNRLKPREVKKASLKFGKNIVLSEDKLSITSEIDGHVVLVEGKVFVNDVLEIKDVDISTGNIDYTGSVTITGNVCENFEVKTKGNIVVNGMVEGATLISGGNIIISKGLIGMSKAVIEAKGHVIAKFIENAKVCAQSYVQADSIMHSNVEAGKEILVSGKHGFITGGNIKALERIQVKNLGSPMGTTTNVEVGGTLEVKERFKKMGKDLEEAQKAIRTIEPVIAAYESKRAAGVKFSSEQIKYLDSLMQLRKVKEKEIAGYTDELPKLQTVIEDKVRANVEVLGTVYAGTRVYIGELSTIVENNYKYCKFVKSQGEVKIIGI